ncbi:hypothetical protein CVT25_015126 [Psilocybe cyanescens]|uniref:Uncharacterized protein n=1 Tax=Psilocybe cyanescens TaxID=93625 RepID=A0A409X258_PSICY|nr:hypothetical protein CVT25_015126 [Psilocybe cyanescens]
MIWPRTATFGLISWGSFLLAQGSSQGNLLGHSHRSYNDGLFVPIEDPSLLPESQFTTLNLPEFPRHSVRVKKSKFCDGTVKYAGLR